MEEGEGRVGAGPGGGEEVGTTGGLGCGGEFSFRRWVLVVVDKFFKYAHFVAWMSLSNTCTHL